MALISAYSIQSVAQSLPLPLITAECQTETSNGVVSFYLASVPEENLIYLARADGNGNSSKLHRIKTETDRISGSIADSFRGFQEPEDVTETFIFDRNTGVLEIYRESVGRSSRTGVPEIQRSKISRNCTPLDNYRHDQVLTQLKAHVQRELNEYSAKGEQEEIARKLEEEEAARKRNEPNLF